MEYLKYRIIFLIIIVTTLISVIFVAFLGCHDDATAYNEQYTNIDNHWIINDKEVNLPCTARGSVVMERKLPDLRDDQILVVQCYFKDAQVYIDGKLVYTATTNVFLHKETNVGHNELKVPLKEAYSGKDVRLILDVQNSVYTRRISDAFIFSESGYVTHLILKNVFALTLASTYFISGIAEVAAAIYYLIHRKKIRARYSFYTLLYTGVFSIVASLWVFCESMVVQAIYGHPTAFAIINDVLFMFMPLTFLELLRSLTNRKKKSENILAYTLGAIAIIAIILCITGITDWNLTEYVGHAMVIAVFVNVICNSIVTLRKEKDIAVRSTISIGNSIFAAFSVTAVICYMLGIKQNYLSVVITGFMFYSLVQVFLIFQRIGISIEEEQEFVTVSEYAYKDDLTGLNNRRYFYFKHDEYEKNPHKPENLTLINIDANRLKYYNDTYGHDAGDELLKGVASCIRKVFGSCRNVVMCRMGGDEFAISMIEDKEVVDQKVEELRYVLLSYKGKIVSDLSVALGYVQAGELPEADLDELYKTADNRMYQDKRRFYVESGIDRRRR